MLKELNTILYSQNMMNKLLPVITSSLRNTHYVIENIVLSSKYKTKMQIIMYNYSSKLLPVIIITSSLRNTHYVIGNIILSSK